MGARTSVTDPITFHAQDMPRLQGSAANRFGLGPIRLYGRGKNLFPKIRRRKNTMIDTIVVIFILLRAAEGSRPYRYCATEALS